MADILRGFKLHYVEDSLCKLTFKEPLDIVMEYQVEDNNFIIGWKDNMFRTQCPVIEDKNILFGLERFRRAIIDYFYTCKDILNSQDDFDFELLRCTVEIKDND